MSRFTPVTLPQGNVLQPVQPGQQGQSGGVSPFQAGVTLGQSVRDEHGREGVRAYISALNPLLPRALLEQIAGRLGVETPPPTPPSMPHAQHLSSEPLRSPQKESPAIPPELLLQLLQGAGGGGGLDPTLLIKLLQK